jgi:hypothetical protein
VVATVRRPGSSIYDLIGTNDMTTDATYFERGINLRHGWRKPVSVKPLKSSMEMLRTHREAALHRRGPLRSYFAP